MTHAARHSQGTKSVAFAKGGSKKPQGRNKRRSGMSLEAGCPRPDENRLADAEGKESRREATRLHLRPTRPTHRPLSFE